MHTGDRGRSVLRAYTEQGRTYQNNRGERQVMKEFTTERGTRLYYKVFYDLGGWNYFTSENTPRGYYLTIRRSPTVMSAFSDLSSKDGAIKYRLFETKRASEKQRKHAEDMAEQMVKTIVAVYNERGYNL